MDVLEQKSQWNSEIAAIAERNGQFDVAVSRYYYSLFQIVAWLLKKESVWDYSTYGQSEDKKNSLHKEIGNQLHNFAKERIRNSCLSKSDYHYLTIWDTLRKTRNKADYEDIGLHGQRDYNSFKEEYDGLAGLLKRNALI